jgi:hypothetical protein
MDAIAELQKLAGINSYKGLTAYEGSNISKTATEKVNLMKENNIQPGTDEWFQLWFSRPYLTNEPPVGFRGRKK